MPPPSPPPPSFPLLRGDDIFITHPVKQKITALLPRNGQGTHVNVIHSICVNYGVIRIIFVGALHAKPNSGMNEVIKNSIFISP